MKWYVYILSCSDGSYYTGHSNDVPRRVRRHNMKDGATHTALHLPAVLVYSDCFPTEDQAIARERQIKRWTRAKKEALITGDLEALKSQARRKSN